MSFRLPILAAGALMFLGASSPLSAQNSDDLVVIAPIGDSVTQGGRHDRPDELSYRHPLAKILKDAGIKFDFVGSNKTGLHQDFVWPDIDGEPFDTDHQGHYGHKTAQVRDILKRDINKWDAPADFALIHLGSNDQKGSPEGFDATVVEPLREMITLLREKNPEVVILLGHLNFTAGTAKTEIRPRVEALAKEMNTEQSPVITVAHYEGFNASPDHPETDTFDWAHPNPRGQEKMARKWFDAMKPYLNKNS